MQRRTLRCVSTPADQFHPPVSSVRVCSTYARVASGPPLACLLSGWVQYEERCPRLAYGQSRWARSTFGRQASSPGGRRTLCRRTSLHSIATGMCRKTNWLFMWRAYLICWSHSAPRRAAFAAAVVCCARFESTSPDTGDGRAGAAPPLSRTSLLVHHSEGSIVKMRNRPRRDGSPCRSSARECRIRRRTY